MPLGSNENMGTVIGGLVTDDDGRLIVVGIDGVAVGGGGSVTQGTDPWNVAVTDGALGFSLADPVDGLGTVRTVQTVAFSHALAGESADLVAAPGAGLQLVILGGIIFAAGPGQIISGAAGPVKAHYDTPGVAFNLGGFPAVILDENDALRIDNDGATATKGHFVVVPRDVP